VLLLVCLVAFGVLRVSHGDSLELNYYGESCPEAENIVQNVTGSYVSSNPNLTPALLRMHFHDCFVRGCDASVLINSTANNTAEKDAIPNLTLVGFYVIDGIKAQVEEACPGVVSCADILALAARDAVSYQFKYQLWEVPTGRRDGIVSLASEALTNIPSPFLNYTSLVQSFASKGLNVKDLSVLSGAHTIGVAHCDSFSNRLYNFTGKGDEDPSLDPTYAAYLKTQCPPGDLHTLLEIEMVPKSSQTFDSAYFPNLNENKGRFQSDAALLTNNTSKAYVDQIVASPAVFYQYFAVSVVKMGNISVLTGTSGEIRKNCSIIN
ncbi:LOW QUALITY PROTEIN: peroxidase domain-containing protein, partial [Cephalotus follicularis]